MDNRCPHQAGVSEDLLSATAQTLSRRCRYVLVVATSMILAACAGGATARSDSSRHAATGSSCVPALPKASKERVRLGGTVAVYSAGLRCRPLFSAPQTYVIRMFPPRERNGRTNYARSITLGSVRVGRRGAFRATVHIPRSIPSGSALLVVRGRELNRRVACPPNASCKYYGVGVDLRSKS